MAKRRSHPAAAFPSHLPRVHAEGEDPGVVMHWRADGTAHCLPDVPGRACPAYTAHLLTTERHCRLSWLKIPFGEGCSGRTEVLHHEPCGADKDDRSQGGICAAHHLWRHKPPPRWAFPEHAIKWMEAEWAKIFRRYCDALRGRP